MRRRYSRRGMTVYYGDPNKNPRRVMFHIEAGAIPEQIKNVDRFISLANLALWVRALAGNIMGEP